MNIWEIIDFAASQGFQCLEAACWPFGGAERKYAGVSHIDVTALNDQMAKKIREYCEVKNVSISALAYYPNIMDAEKEKRNFYITHLLRVIDAAALMDIGLVTTFIGRIPDRNTDENLAEYERVWKPIVRYAEEKKVRIAIENCPMLFTADEWPGGKNLASSPPIWREMFARIPSDYLGLNYDPSHMVWQRIDYINPVYEFRDKIFHVHYKDIKIYEDRLSDAGILALPLAYMEPKIPGHGDVDWGKYITALLDIGYQGAACIEIEDRCFEDSLESRKNALLISKRYLSQFI